MKQQSTSFLPFTSDCNWPVAVLRDMQKKASICKYAVVAAID